ncbi:MAG: gamma-glutamyl-gamma-aminobutyrate hydrolase family protein [Thermoleophilia bacterium]
MSRAPVIGVCTPLERARWAVWDMPASLVAANYLSAVWAAGGRTVLIPPDPALAESPDDIIDVVDGLLLVGGADIEATRYGAQPHRDAEPAQVARDAVEVALTRRAAERGVPVLGICRGLQVINVAAGGTLHQHLPESHGTSEHRRTLGRFEGNEHEVVLTPGSRAAAAAGEDRHVVVSHHHQAVDRLGDGLACTGVAEDGVVEAIEGVGPGYLLGVQWHPEAQETSRVIASLVQAARERAARPAA